MKSFVHNIFTLIIALIGLIGGVLWCLQSNWDYEPVILMLISLVEIISYFVIPKDETTDISTKNNTQNIVNTVSHSNGFSTIANNGNKNLNNNIDIQISGLSMNAQNKKAFEETKISAEDKNLAIESKKNKISILFIDDDKNFNIVKILKASGWKNTKTIVDIKTLDDSNLKNSEIIFVDINGVGKLLDLPNEGLDLALMIKQKYPNKKVIIYSASNSSNSFHEAWDLADSRLVKNALPYQFEHLVEKFSLEYYNN